MIKNKRNLKEHANKERNQRIMHVYSSQSGLSEPSLKAPTFPLKKYNKPSSSNLFKKSKEKLKKDRNKGHSSMVKIKAPEVYERIPINIANSNTNSEIQFSNCGETLKNGNRLFRKDLFIHCDKESIMRQIWNMDKNRNHKQNEAATKIQKVFRGFMTRKLLQKYIEEYQQKLKAEISEIKRKGTFLSSNQEDSFYDCSLKNQSYFLSDKKKSKKRSFMFGYPQNSDNFEYDSSIRQNSHSIDQFLSVQEPDLLQKMVKEERKSSFPQKSNLTLNQSSIQHPQVSLSFGYEIQPSPHFVQPQAKIEKEEIIASPIDMRKNLAGLSEDNTRDGYSQNLTTSPNYYQRNKSQKSQSHLTSLQRYYASEDLVNGIQEKTTEKLKSSEKAKWQKVIEFVNENFKGHFDYQKTKAIMQAILEFSVRNREQLNKHEEQSLQVCPPTAIFQNRISEDPSHRMNNQKWQQNILLQKSMKNQNMPLARQLKVQKSIMERTSIMKEYFLKNMCIQDHQIDQMMQLRESVLRRKQSESLKELNYLLQNNLLTQDDFIDRLSQLTHNFQNQKKDIEQLKSDIYQGYKAQLQLYQKTAIDAKFLGFQIPFCRSMEIFPYRPQWRFDDVMIDQLNQVASRKLHSKHQEEQKQDCNEKIEMKEQPKRESPNSPLSISRQLFQESESEQDQDFNKFSIEQTQIYKEFDPYINPQLSTKIQGDFTPSKMKQVSPFSKCSAVSIFQDIDNSKQENLLDNINEKEEKVQLRKESYKINTESQGQAEEILYKKEEENKTLQFTQFCMNSIIWEFLEEMCLSKNILRRLPLKNNKKKPEKLALTQRVDFLQMCLKNLPSFKSVQHRLNQKMYPNIRQLLYSMRDVQGQEEDSEYIQIGHYQYILNQQICFSLIEMYLEEYRNKRQIKTTEISLSQQFKNQYHQFSSNKLRRFLFERKIEVSKLNKYLQESRQQFLRIQLHMFFDVWNEELIKHRQNKNGYSGIGLNEISQVLIDRVCKEMKDEEQYKAMMLETEQKIQKDIQMVAQGELLYQDEYQKNVINDSQWIFYTQQALEYGFDIIKMVQIQLFFEFIDEISTITKGEEKEGHESSALNSDEQNSLLNTEEERHLKKKLLQFDEDVNSQEDSFYS